MKKLFSYLGIIIASASAGIFLSQIGILHMKTTKAFTTSEPLLIEGEKQNSFSILPMGTVLYLDKSWPEGHDTYHVYFHFKGKLPATSTNGELIAPIWLRTVDRSEIAKLLTEYPLTKEELKSILKAQNYSKDELVQILRELNP